METESTTLAARAGMMCSWMCISSFASCNHGGLLINHAEMLEEISTIYAFMHMKERDFSCTGLAAAAPISY